MVLKPTFIKLIISVTLALFVNIATAQTSFEIIDHEVNDKDQLIDLYIKGLKNGKSFLPANRSAYSATEVIQTDTNDTGKMTILPNSIINFGNEEFRLLFLLDKSGSMRGAKFIKAKAAIRSALKKYALPDSVAYFSYFNESTSTSQIVDLNNFPSVVGSVTVEPIGKGKDTHLYNSLQEKLNEWRLFGGRKVIILLTDGQNDIYGNDKDKELNEPFATMGGTPVSESDLLSDVRSLDSSFMINCIGYGYDVDSVALKKIVNASHNSKDRYLFAATPDDIGKVLQSTPGEYYNLKLSVHPDDFCDYFGNPRTLSLQVMYQGIPLIARYNYINGEKSSTTVSYCYPVPYKSFLQILPWCLSIVGGLLILFVTLLPGISHLLFRRKHVRKYKHVKKDDIIRTDPITTLEFKDEDKVVVGVCNHINLYQSWKDKGDRCGEKNCAEGFSKHSTSSNFFNQGSDITQRLNWIWFGALGGAIGWLLYNLFELVNKKVFADFFRMFSEQGFFDSYQHAMNTGAGLGFGIGLTFAIVEEKGQSRELNWGRIILRAFLGFVVGATLFLGINYLFINWTQQLGFVSNLFSWLLFGTLISALTSIRSSIELKSALLAGLLASAIGFFVYYLIISNNIIPNKQIAKVIALITYGALLGVILNSVVSSLEDFHLEYIAPAHVRRKNPISKWLKGSIPEINIGNDSGSYVYIKWDPEVLAKHATLTYENGKVFINPKGHTIINGKTIKNKTALNNHDIIKLGDKSITSMRFNSSKHKQQQKEEVIMKAGKNRPTPEIEFYDIESSSQSKGNDSGITFE